MLDRDPFVYEGSTLQGTRHVPQVQMLRVHTNLLHDNASSSGYSTAALQFPFMSHYHEADPSNPYSHAFVSYEEPHMEHAGLFELINGLESLGLVRFWVTDEQNRIVRTKPQVPIHLALTLRAETTVRKRKHTEDMQKMARENVGLQRLLLLQNDSNHQAARIGLLNMQNTYDGTHDQAEIFDQRNKRNKERGVAELPGPVDDYHGQVEGGPDGWFAAPAGPDWAPAPLPKEQQPP